MIVSGSSYKFSQEKIGYELYDPDKGHDRTIRAIRCLRACCCCHKSNWSCSWPKNPPTIVLASSLKSQGGASF